MPAPGSAAGAAIRKARCLIQPGPAAFEGFDGFVRGLGFLSPRERDSIIVAGDEVLDNLLTHGEIGPAGVVALVRKRAGGVTLAFLAQSHESFAAFAARGGPGATEAPRFDEREGRWRGLGLTMCRNLASAVAYRPGERLDRVFLTFR